MGSMWICRFHIYGNAQGLGKEAVMTLTLSNAGVQWGGVTPLTQVDIWELKALAKVTELGRLREGWDGYGSRSIQPAALERISSVINVLSSLRLPNPEIFPVPGGGLQIEMELAGKEIEIEILPNGSIEYLLV